MVPEFHMNNKYYGFPQVENWLTNRTQIWKEALWHHFLETPMLRQSVLKGELGLGVELIW